MKTSAMAMVLLVLSAATAQAACPPLATGSDSAAIAANQQRLLCQHQEIHQDAMRRHYEFQIETNRNAIQQLELQRRFDMLPRPGAGWPLI